MVAALVFLWYDYSLTFDAEVKLVWNHRWSLGKALFILNRYFGLVTILFDVTVFFSGSLTDQFCKRFSSWHGVSNLLGVLIGQLILMARVYAVYNRNKKVLAVLAALFVAQVACLPLVLHVGNYIGTATIPGLTGCYASSRPALYFLVTFPSLIYDTILCLLMVYQAWKIYKDGSNYPLMTVLIRDSVLYFFTNFSITLVNCLIVALAPHIIGKVALGWLVAVPCALGSRLLLNMREHYFREETEDPGLELGGVRSSGMTTGILFSDVPTPVFPGVAE